MVFVTAPALQIFGAGSVLAAQGPTIAPLSAEERAAGWRQLFDGTLSGWRGYAREDVPSAWSVVEDALQFRPNGDGGDLVTVDVFGDFELALQWKVARGGNSGVFYRVAEGEPYPYWTGPEFQVLDNRGHPDGSTPETSAGANYGLYPPVRDVTRPVGEWNDARIVVRGRQVEHWLNGVRVVVYELGSEDWRRRLSGTKFADWPGYGRMSVGHIGLQDHGDPVWYRNIRIRTF